ncbi:MAG TPA: DMT family transporter [Rhodospirillales bacterium]|nr:DMT family transporter [Rhodospirillales bacterium]
MSGPIRGALWITLANMFFTAMAGIIRYVSADIHPFEIAFFRALFGLILMAPWFLRLGVASVRSRRVGMHVCRALFMLGAAMAWFTAISLMPIAEVTALTFTTPLFASLGAALFLAEKVGLRRAVAIGVGFAGAMIILRPGVEALTMPAMAALASAVFGAVGMLIVKSLSRSESPATIVIYVGLLLTPLSLVPALFVWTTPSLEALAWLAALGLVANLGHMPFARAMASADATAILPFDFLKLFFSATMGYLLFAEVPDVWTWIGATVIFGAVLYTARRESKAAGPPPAK